MNWAKYQTACRLLRSAIADRAHIIAIEHSKLQPDADAILAALREKNQCCDRLYALTPFLDEEIEAIMRQYGPDAIDHRARTAGAGEATHSVSDRRGNQDRRSGMADRRSAPRWPNTGWPSTEQA